MKRSAIFIDQDSVLEDAQDGPEATPRLRPRALPALAALAAHGFSLVLLSGRAGERFALGSVGALTERQQQLRRLIARDGEAEVTDMLACPHLPGPNGKPACHCRLPRPGLILEAARRHHLSLKRCWLIGAGKQARRAARRAGCRSLVLGDGRKADAGDLMAAARKILRKHDPVDGMITS